MISAKKHGVECLALGLVLSLALFLRFHDLGGLPVGLHGDEGVTGLEAARILKEGSIGPYSPLALGQPAGPLYLFALAVAMGGHSIGAVRSVAAAAGLATVLLLWFLARPVYGRPAAVLAALLLGVMAWHIHFSRVAFPVIFWPLLGLAAVAALARTAKSLRWTHAALSGALAAAGLYVYNAHFVFFLPLALFGCGFVMTAWKRRGKRQLLWCVCAFAAAFVAVLMPLILFAMNPNNGYWLHFSVLSHSTSPDWQLDDGLAAKVATGWRLYGGYWKRMLFQPKFDYSDGTGLFPLLSPWLMIPALFGLLQRLIRRPSEPLTWLGALLLFLMPLAAVFSSDVYGGAVRRTLLIAPWVALFAVVGWSDAIRRAAAWRKSAGYILATGCAIWFAWWGGWEIRRYFCDFRNSELAAWVFCDTLTAASLDMNRQPSDAHILFFSPRWSFDYETRRYLAPAARGEDRSIEFGAHSTTNLAVPAGKTPAFFLFERYADLRPTVEALYPDAYIWTDGKEEEP